MSNRDDKPKRNAKQLVEKMRDEKGITFQYDREEDAEFFLAERNNYLRLTCYRVSFPKYIAGKNKGKYIRLDFAYLKELSVLDMHYRFLAKKMCSDIEHSLCVNLLKQIEEDTGTDGYDIVEKFLAENPTVLGNVERSIGSPHTHELICKYFTVATVVDPVTKKKRNKIRAYDDCPAWVLVECLTFGDLISFYRFCCMERGYSMVSAWEILNLVRSLRNGVSHDNCMLCYLPAGSSVPPRELTNAVQNLGVVTVSQRQKKLSSRTVLEFTALLYLYSILVSGKVREHRVAELKELFYGRMVEKRDFFRSNELLVTTYGFATKMIEGFFAGE